MTVLLLERRWDCPKCPSKAVTRDGKTPMHPCRGVKGLMIPLVPEGTRCKVEAVERGDWVGEELVQTDAEGRPVMAVVTTRDDGQDCTVYAPTAQGEKE
ncbi:hypothetical protein ACFWYW_55830 [Nonomuraea sp. NPDC059023]|uniref:hypothetical protein n=1 Tax=unclassified Nonomuraea TaxID=2593643 RepID=UPI0036BDBCDD